MRKFWAQPLRRQLLIAIVLLLVPALVAAVWAGVATLRERQDDLRTQSRELALTTAAWVNRDLNIIDRMAASIGGIAFLQQMNPELTGDLFRRAVVTRPNWLDILLVRADGTLVSHGAAKPPAVDPGTLWASRVISENRRVIIPIDTSRRAPQHLVIGYPVHDASGATVGALGYLINLQSLQDSLAALPLRTGSVVIVTDEESRI